ncbi:hypothetical protein CR513_28502, partial [Mucuna pruriens]
MDSGATRHMTPHRYWFCTYEPISGGSVFMGNNHALEIAGVGTVKIKMYDGTVRTIQGVRHVKDLKKNLLSIGQLDDLGCKIHVEDEILKIVKGNLVVMKAEKITTNLYTLLEDALQVAIALIATSSQEEAMMMYHRLGNMSKQGLKVLVEHNLLLGLKMFKEFKAQLELKTCKTIKCLKIDNQGEYVDGEFLAFCKQEGIVRQFSVPHTPQQNGVAERMNRTLLERTRAMLQTAGVAKSFWAEAVKTACYVINRSPSTAIGLSTPMEGYCLWDPTSIKVVISRDVVFIENELQIEQKNDSITKDTTIVQIEKKTIEDESKVEQEHENQEPNEVNNEEAQQTTRQIRKPSQHSNYVNGSLDAYCLLAQEREPSTFQKAMRSLDMSLWIIA